MKYTTEVVPVLQGVKMLSNCMKYINNLTLSRRRPLSYRNQSIDLQI